MSELDISQNVEANTLNNNLSLLSIAVAIDLISSSVARVAGNDIADTLNGSPVVGETLDSVVTARLGRALIDRNNALKKIEPAIAETPVAL